MKNSSQISLSGRSTLRAYPAGTLSGYEGNFKDLPAPLWENQVNNLVVQAGKDLVAKLLTDTEPTGLTWHAFGTSGTPPAIGDIALGAEVGRKAFTIRERISSSVVLSVFYLASECAFNIAEAGVFGGSTASSTPGSGTLFSHYNQAYNNAAGLVDITFEYELEIQ